MSVTLTSWPEDQWGNLLLNKRLMKIAGYRRYSSGYTIVSSIVKELNA